MSLAAMDLALRAVFDEERDCESVDHFTRPDGHLGTAEWYVHVKHECGHNVVKAYCDRFVQVLSVPSTPVYCAKCMAETTAGEHVQSFTKIGS